MSTMMLMKTMSVDGDDDEREEGGVLAELLIG